jgi:hypothetical protein
VSAELDELLKLLAKIEKEAQPPPGPIVLTDEYLRLLERYEALPQSRPGADRTWVGTLVAESDRFLASVLRQR